jgi:hypothetical protein
MTEQETTQKTKSNKKRIKWYEGRASLSQALSSGLEYAFVSKERKQCCPFVLCKDFLQDAVYNQVYKTKKSIYGFSFDPSKHEPIDLTKVRMVLANSQDADFSNKIPACLDFINQIEACLGIVKTKTIVRECAFPPKKYKKGGVWYFESNRRWLSSPVMLSLYTLLLRVGFCHKIGDTYNVTIERVSSYSSFEYQQGDRSKLYDSKKGIVRILKKGDKNIFYKEIEKNYPKGISISTLHNDLGIVAFSNEYTKHTVPYWHRND